MVTEFFTKTYLPKHPVQPFQSVAIEDANGQMFLGYVPITFKFPREIVKLSLRYQPKSNRLSLSRTRLQ